MLKLLKLLKAYKKESILSPVFKLVEVAFELTIPLLVANIIDVGIGTGNKPYIVKMCALMGLFGVLGLAACHLFGTVRLPPSILRQRRRWALQPI